jgi:hypothetical protein
MPKLTDFASPSSASSSQSNPITGVFGTGRIQFFGVSGTFTVPAGITSVRARVWAAGATASANGGSGGCGFSIKTIIGLTPGATIAVTVGQVSGASSSFGAYNSATGGSPGSALLGGAGGSGVGGDFNYTGGAGGTAGANSNYCGGGGAANILGNGGAGGGSSGSSYYPGSCGASGGGGATGTAAGTPGGGGTGFTGIPGAGGPTTSPYSGGNATMPQYLTSIDFIGTGSGGGASNPSGGYGGAGINGGGGAGQSSSGPLNGGGFPGGGAGAGGSVIPLAAPGLVIVEW